MTRIMLSLLLLQASLVAAQNSSTQFEVASIKQARTTQYIPPRIDPQRFHIVDDAAAISEISPRRHPGDN